MACGLKDGSGAAASQVISGDMLRGIAASCPNLVAVKFEGTFWQSADSSPVDSAMPSLALRHLQKLQLWGGIGDDSLLFALAQNSPCLAEFEVSYNPWDRITDFGFVA